MGRARLTAFLLSPVREDHTMEHSVLGEALQALDASDHEILRLLTLRSRLAWQLARAYMQRGRSADNEDRLSDVVSRLTGRNAGPLDDESLRQLFRAVIQATEPPCTSISANQPGGKKG